MIQALKNTIGIEALYTCSLQWEKFFEWAPNTRDNCISC